jgi:hypothetical protein
MTDDELAALDAAADRQERRRRPPRWRTPHQPPDQQTRDGDLLRGLWQLHEAHTQLIAECAEQRRRRLVSTDPTDAFALRAAAERTEAALLDLDAALLPDQERDEHHHYREQVVSLLTAATPGAADRYMRAISDASDALIEADRLEDARDPGAEYDRLSLRALHGHPRGPHRATAVLRLAGHLLAVGARVGCSLALLESWDRDHCRPPLGSDECERLLRYVAGRQADRLEGAA